MTLTHEDVATLTARFEAHEHDFVRGFVYISEDAITPRLTVVDPNWTWQIIQLYQRDNDVVAVGRLTICDVSRDGVGQAPIMDKGAEAEKSAATDALKRAARLFGVGAYLLNAPKDLNAKNIGAWLGGGNVAPTPQAPRNPEPQQQPAAQGDVHVHATGIKRKHSTNGQRHYFTLTLATDTPTPSVNTNNIQLLHTANIHTTDLTEQVTVFPYPLELIIYQNADNNGKLWWNVKQFLDKLPESHWANDDELRAKTAAYLSEKCNLPELTFKELMDCMVQDKPPSDFATHKDFCQYFVNYQKVHPEVGIQYRNAYTDAQRSPADDDISNIPF